MNNEPHQENMIYPIQGTISTDFGPKFFSTDENTARILLMKYHEAIKRQADWFTIAGIAIALLAPFVTADFRSFLGIDPSYWKFLFLIGLALCIIKIVNSVISAIIFYNETNIEKVVSDLRAGNTKVETSNTLIWIITRIKQWRRHGILQ